MVKKEIIYFFTALMFFTRIPIPFKLPYSNEIMNQSQKYYAAIGLLVGAFNALIYFLCQLILPIDISILISMCASVLLTGAFHEDGFTDVCDSFGGGYGKEKIMTIMKDSRIGAYGVIGVILLLLLKFTSLKHLAENNLELVLFTIITAHSVSRFFSGMMIYTHEYVTDIDKSKSKPMANKALPIQNLIISFLFCFLPFIVFGEWEFLLILPLCYIGKVYLGWYFKKYIGGYTGDCLGTVQQVTEVLFYLGVLILCKLM